MIGAEKQPADEQAQHHPADCRAGNDDANGGIAETCWLRGLQSGQAEKQTEQTASSRASRNFDQIKDFGAGRSGFHQLQTLFHFNTLPDER